MNKKTTRLQDLAERAGVSIATASRALNDRPSVNIRTKQRVWQLARELDYPFRQHMPAGPIGAKATISIVVPRPQGRPTRLADPFFFEMLAGVSDAARARGCDVHISHVAPSSYVDLHMALTTHRADGVIFLGQSDLHSAFNRLAEQETPFVVWGAELPDQHYCCVGSDNEQGGERATEHLLRLGRRQIVFLGQTEAPEFMQRFRGWRHAQERYNLPIDERRFVPTYLAIESAEAATEALIESGVPFDGIVAASDVIAFGALKALKRAGRKVPEDVSLTGYDNVGFARYAEPALTTIDQDMAAAGRLMLAKLLDFTALRARRSERLSTNLIVRQSCGG